jgi:hypothetical protein
MRKEAFLNARALPSRSRDLTHYPPEWLRRGAALPPLPFRPLSRRSGRIPASPYPPLR